MANKMRLAILVSDIMALRGKVSVNDEKLTRAAKDMGYYADEIERNVRNRFEGKTTDAEFIALMGFLIGAQLRRAAREAMRDMDVEAADVELENELARLQEEEKGHVRELLAAILAALAIGASFETLRWRVNLWKYRYLDMYNRTLIILGRTRGKRLIWRYGATEKHCRDCAHYEGQIKTAVEWDEIYRLFGHRPQSHTLACGGWQCDCRLEVVG